MASRASEHPGKFAGMPPARSAVEVATPGYLATAALGRPSSPIAAWAKAQRAATATLFCPSLPSGSGAGRTPPSTSCIQEP